MRKAVVKILSLVMVLAMLLSFSVAAFASVGDKKDELDDINERLKKIAEAQRSNESYITSLSAEIIAIGEKINALNVDIDALTKEINETKALIVKKIEELELKQSEIDEQDAALNSRLRAMYKNGNAGMLSVLLHSSSITELLTNIEMAKRIYASDSNLLYKMHVEYDVIYQAKLELSNLKDKLQDQYDELEEKRTALAVEEAAAVAKRAEAQSSNKELKAQEDTLKQQADALATIIKEMQNDAEVYVYGEMCWPSEVSTFITSEFGYRYIFGGYSFHTGIDIGAWGGSNILAANSGTVLWVGWDPNGYGNYVMIDHGGGVVTLYAHSCRVLVETGEYVKKGQPIALVGTTGLSTGNHLHFEIRVNGSYQNPLDKNQTYYVVPGRYSYD